MTKKKLNQKSNKQIIYVGGLVVVLAIAGLAFVLFGMEAEDCCAVDTPIEQGLIDPVQYQTQFVEAERQHFLLDVRTPEEFAAGHIAGAVNIPLQVLDQYLSDIPTDQTVVLYCRSGNRSDQAMGILRDAGYSDLYDIDGGTIAWTNNNLPLQR